MNSYTLQMIAQQRIEESARRADHARVAREWTPARRSRRRGLWSVPTGFPVRLREAR